MKGFPDTGSSNVIDKLISAEIPDQNDDPEYYSSVSEFMMHGTCGVANKKSPCIANDCCTKHFPKTFVERTTHDDGCVVYQRRNNGRRIIKGGVELDNRYISASEGAWRLSGYEIHYNGPDVVRLGFHLENQQNVVFRERSSFEQVLKMMFKAWFKANVDYEWARELTYVEFPTKFVWVDDKREWKPRERGLTIGRLAYVYPGCDELYYLSIMLNVFHEATCYDDVNKYNGVQYNTFRDAGYAWGLLDDDKKYVDAIKEASFWGSEKKLSSLFMTLLTSDSISRPE